MDFTQWSQLVLVCVMGAMSPGPSLAVVLRNTVSGGRTQGMLSGIGHGLGITFYAVIAVAGLVTLLNTIPNFFIIAQVIGAIFLAWLGGKMIFSSLRSGNNKDEESHPRISGRGFLEGFLIAFFNPKIAVWLLALFSQFVRPEAAFPEQSVLVLTVGGIDAAWYCLVAFLASSGGLVKGLRRNAKRLDLGMGILLILLATGMLRHSFA